MHRRFTLGIVGLVLVLACDDAHKADEAGVGGHASATGGKSSIAPDGAGTAGSTANDSLTCTYGGFQTDGGAVGTTAACNAGAATTSGGAAFTIGGAFTARGGAASSIGGGASIAGAAGGPSVVDETCPWPAVQFEFTLDDPALYCVSSSLAWPNSSYGGIRIRTPEGRVVTHLSGRKGNSGFSPCAWPRCGTCDPYCTEVQDPVQRQATSEPKTGTWDGGYDVAGTCGITSQTCYATRCVAPGRYIARYCVAPKGVWSSCGVGPPNYFFAETACVEVPFDFPTTEVVRGQITKAAVPNNTGGFAGMAGTAGSAGTAGNAGTAGSAGSP